MLLLCYSGDELDEVSIGIAQERVAVVFTDVVRWLDDGSAGGFEMLVGIVDVVYPYDERHGMVAGRRVDSMDPLGCFNCAKPEAESTECKLDMLRGPAGWGSECFFES